MPNYPYTFQLPPLNVQDIPNDGVAGEFLGINGSGVLDWLTAGGAGDMLKADNLSGLASYPTARTNLGLGTGDSPTFANLTLTSPSLVSSAPVTISQTWNNAAVAFTGLKVNAAGTSGTNSAAASKFLDLQLNGVSKLSVDKSGIIALPQTGGDASALICGGSAITNAVAYIGIYGIRLDSTSSINWAPGNNLNVLDTILLRDGAANTLALRNGANAQTFNVYGTSSSSNTVYERMFMRYTAASTLAFQIGTEMVGATARPLQFSINGSKRLIFEATGVNDTQIYAAGNTARNILTLRSLDESGRYQFYINAAGKSELYVGTGVLISEAGSSYFNGGNVGIGTTAPGAKLTVITPFNNYPTDKNPVISLRQSTDNTFGFDWIQDGQNTGDLHLHRVNSGVSNHVLAITRGAGNVGIGTTAPSTLLEVALPSTGNTLYQGIKVSRGTGYFSLGNGTSGTPNNFLGLFLGKGGISGTAAALGFQAIAGSDSDTSTALVFFNVRNTSDNGTILDSQIAYQFRNYLTNLVTVLGSGNVGIGTTSPTSKLHVASGATTILQAGTNAGIPYITAGDTAIYGDAIDSLELRRTSSAAQTIKLYGTYTASPLAYERLTISAPSSTNAIIGTERTGTGALARGLEFQTDGVTRMTIAAAGGVTVTGVTTSSGGFSATGLGFSCLTTGFIYWASSTTMSAPSDGLLKITNTAGNDFNRIQLGGTTSAFPAIKRSSTTIQARLADDTAFAPIQGKLTTDTAYTATVVAATGYITIYDSIGTAYRVPCAL